MQLWRVPISGGQATQVTKDGGFYGIESYTPRLLYLWKPDDNPGVWLLNLDTGLEREIVPGPVFWQNLVLTRSGLYYSRLSFDFISTLRVYRFNPDTREEALVYETRSRNDFAWLSVSPDEQSILFTKAARVQTELMLVENFH